MNNPEYKLDLNLLHVALPPEPTEKCVLCDDVIEGVNYILTVVSPNEKSVYFDERCFEQVLAIGFKYIRESNLKQQQETIN